MPRLLFLVLAGLLLLPVSGLADTSVESTPGFQLAVPTNISEKLQLQADAAYMAEADFTGGLGSVAVTRASLMADYHIFRLTYGVSRFTWGDKRAVTFSTGDSTPWNELHDISLKARLLNNKLTDNWRYWVNAEVTSAFEAGFPGAVGAGLDGGVGYEFWDGWMLGGTLKTIALSALNGDLFGDAELGIAVVVSQKALREGLQSLGLMEDAKEGSEKIGFTLGFSSSEKTYRLASGSSVQPDGYLGLVRSTIGAYLSYSPDENWTFTLGPEYHYGRRYRLYNSAGTLGSSHNLEDTFGGYGRILFSF